MTSQDNHKNRRILVVDDSPALHDLFRKILVSNGRSKEPKEANGPESEADRHASGPSLKYELDTAHQGQEGFEKVQAAVTKNRSYALAFVDMRMPGWDGLTTIERMWEVDPNLQVVICTGHSDNTWADISQRLGHSDRLLILKKPFDIAEVSQLAAALTDKWNQAEFAREKLSQLEFLLEEQSASTEQTASANIGQIVAVLGCSGGVGTSTVAVNLAAVLAQNQASVLLVDLNIRKGDLAALLDRKPAYTLADLCHNSERLDQNMLEKALLPHECGIHLLAAPTSFDSIDRVTSPGVEQVMQLGIGQFRFTVVDLEDCLQESQQRVLAAATIVVLVIRLDFHSLQNAQRILEQIDKLGIPRSRVHVVVNRSGRPNELPGQDAEAALRTKIRHSIPDDPKNMNAACNTGVPVVVKRPGVKVSLSLARLGRLFLQPNHKSAVKPTLFKAVYSKFFSY